MAIALMKMFWKSMYMPSKINTILEKEDATLEEVVAEDDAVDECKSGNSKLLDFLTRSDNLEKLVDMMVDEPLPEVEEKLKYKNAHQACEILTSDSSQITDALAERSDLLQRIYSFFERDPPINPLQASFFSKTMGLLITHKSEKMLEFFKSHGDFTERLAGHLDTSAMADLLLRLVTCIDNVTCRNQCFQWLNEQGLVEHLIRLIDVHKSNEVHSNASQSICDIIRLSREHQYQHHSSLSSASVSGSESPVAPDDVLLRAIESSETVNELLDRALPDGDPSRTSESLVTNTVLIVQTLLEPRKTSTNIFSIVEDTVISEMEEEEDKENEKSKENNNANNNNGCNGNNNNEHVNRITECVVSRLQGFFDVLSNPPKQRFDPMPSTFGELRPPLGPSRLAVVRFFNALLALGKTSDVERRMAELGVPSKLLSLFFEYPWNNFLHGEVEKFVFHAVNSTSSPNTLLNALLHECRLVERTCEELDKHFKTTSSEEEQEPSEVRRRPGYLGHLTSVANLLAGKFNSSPGLLQGLSPQTQTRWSEFAATTLEEIARINNTDLGVGIGTGQGHVSSSDDDDEDDDFHGLLPPHDDLQRAFNNYQAQLLTTDFPEGFGFTEDDFNEADEPIGSPFKDRISSLDFNLDSVEDSPVAAASFRQACQDRIQQFDCPEGDEEEDDGEAGSGREDRGWSTPGGIRQVPRLNLLSVMERETTPGKGRFGSRRSEEEEEENYDEDDGDYRNDFGDSEDDLDSPSLIVSRTNESKETTRPDVGPTVNGNVDAEEEDDDYESLHDSDTSALMDASFIGGAGGDDDGDCSFVGGDDDNGIVKVNGTATPHDLENVGGGGGPGSKPSNAPVAHPKPGKMIGAGDVGSAVDAAEALGT